METDKQVTTDRQGRRPLLVQQGPNTQVLQAMLHGAKIAVRSFVSALVASSL